MAKPTAQQCHAMTTYFASGFKSKYGRSPVVNRHAARWGWESVLMDMPTTEAKALVDYYLETNSENNHSLDWFFYNYDKLILAMAERDKDREERRRLREESARRAAEWRARGNTGIGD